VKLGRSRLPSHHYSIVASKMTKDIAEVEVRVARAEDKEAVLAFCKHTWENQPDYIHLVWDKWLTDPTGRIFVAVVDSLPVAMERLF